MPEEKPKKEKSEEESELEEILEEENSDEEDDEKKETSKEKSKPKKLPTIIPEFSESEFRNRNMLNFLNRNSSVTLNRKNPFEEFSTNLEENLEQETNSPTTNQNQNPENENPFEYIPKNAQEEKQQGIYQHYENMQGTKVMRQEELKNLSSKPFQGQQAGFVQSESGRGIKEESHYAAYVPTSRAEELQKEKKEKGVFFTEAKKEYYSHDH